MKLETTLKLDPVEVKQSERGLILIAYDKQAGTMLDLFECIADIEERIARLGRKLD